MVTTLEGDYELDNVYDGLDDVRVHHGERITMGFEEALRHLKGNVNVRRRSWEPDTFLTIHWYTLGDAQYYLLARKRGEEEDHFTYLGEDIRAEDWQVV